MTDNASNADSPNRVVELEWTSDRPPSDAVVDAVAAATDGSPLELEPLQESFDTDALNALVASQTNGVEPLSVTFVYEEFGVVVDSTGRVAVHSEPVRRS